MQPVQGRQTLPWSSEFLQELAEDDFRQAFIADQVRTNVAFQIKALRDQRGWTQKELAEKVDKPANSISRLENPDYGKLTLTTLVEMANAFDVALLVQFVEHDDWLNRMEDVAPSALRKRSFNLARLLALARASRQGIEQTTQQPSLEHILPAALGGSINNMKRVSQAENQGLSLNSRKQRQRDVLSGKPYEQGSFL